MQDPIIIIGCARSGTSITAGMISICGAFGGDMYGPSAEAQRGMFENRYLRMNVIKPYLKSIGVDPMGQKPLPNNRQVFEVSPYEAYQWHDLIVNMIQKEGYKDGPWFVKCTKSAHLWYMWHLAFPHAKWVIVRRNHRDIINSCLKTRFMRAYRDQAGWQKWIDQHEKRFAEIRTAGLDFIEFWPSKLCNGDWGYAKRIVNTLGLEFNKPMVQAFIEPKWFSQQEVANG